MMKARFMRMVCDAIINVLYKICIYKKNNVENCCNS